MKLAQKDEKSSVEYVKRFTYEALFMKSMKLDVAITSSTNKVKHKDPCEQSNVEQLTSLKYALIMVERYVQLPL